MERFCERGDMRDNVWMDDDMRMMLCMRWGVVGGQDIVEGG